MIWYEGLVWIIISYIVGCISMFTYVCVRLRQFGWNWKLMTSVVSENKTFERCKKCGKDIPGLWQFHSYCWDCVQNWRVKNK